MRNLFFLIILCLCGSTVSAYDTDSCQCDTAVSGRDTTCDSLDIQAVIDACISMRDAAAAEDSAAIRQSAFELREAGVKDFSILRCSDDTIASLNGHLVFNDEFADSLADNPAVYDNADEFRRTNTHRGVTANGSYFTKTGMAKAGQSTKYTFVSRGYQELAVVAEAGGLVTMRIHATNNSGLDQRYDDTKLVKKGMPQRKTSFTLPSDKKNTVELEVINCGNKDCSFVVISN